MAWRKVHLGDEVWEWQVSKGMTDDGVPRVVIRAPSGLITTITWNKWETIRGVLRGKECPIKVLSAITPGTVKAHIERNRTILMVKPEKRRRREKEK
jgi:hypothetical protein